MLWECLLLFIRLISASPASAPGSGMQLSSSNVNPAVAIGRNHVLGAWPNIPWKMDIPRTDLSLNFGSYGRFADQSKWPAIKKDLDGLQAWFDAEKTITEELLDFLIFARDTFTLSLSRLERTPRIIDFSAYEAFQVVQTIKGIFFTYKDKPREFRAAMFRREQPNVQVELVLFWDRDPSNWPVDLPWLLTSDRGVDITVQYYGIDMDPKGTLTNAIARDISYLRNGFEDEGPDEGPIDHMVYRHRYLRLEIHHLIPELAIKRWMMQDLLLAIRDQYFHISAGKVAVNCGPREVGVYFSRPGKGNFAKVLITFKISFGDDEQIRNVTEA
ncbi:MAG: hypothetical protein L6R41_007873 [Letrouitia leprolyta]|nr:MAG: hypothetical protein L6R41_007873 [Letrouitia leprolyta]